MKNTFVITIEEDVVEFLDHKTQGGGDANAYINDILNREMKRQQRKQNTSAQRGSEGSYPQDLQEMMDQTPDAAR